MTTLELALDIATAARGAKTLNLGAIAVLKTLELHGTWFCRQREVEGITVDEPLPRPHVVIGKSVAPPARSKRR